MIFNVTILVAYLLFGFYYKFRADTLISLCTFLVILLLPVSYNAVPAYSLFASIYLFSSYLALKLRAGGIQSLCLLIMGLYCSIFAIDSGINSDVETWIYINHEIIIAIIHFIICMSFVDKLRAVVGSAASYISNISFGFRDRAIGNRSYQGRNIKSEDKKWTR